MYETVDAVSLRSRSGERWLAAGDGGGDGVGVSAGSVARGGSGLSDRCSGCHSRCTRFERVAHLVGNSMEAKREEVERALVETMEIPDGAHASVYLFDRVSIPDGRAEAPGQRSPGKGVRKRSPVRVPVKEPEKEFERSPKRNRQRCPFNAYFGYACGDRDVARCDVEGPSHPSDMG